MAPFDSLRTIRSTLALPGSSRIGSPSMTVLLSEERIVRLIRMPANRQKVAARYKRRAGKQLNPRQADSAPWLLRVR